VTRRDRRTVEVRREEILTATTELLDRVGLAAIRVADVADALGVSPALVFYHFGTKDALVADAFAHAVDRDLDRLDRATAKDADPLDRLRRVLRLYGPTGAATGWRLWIDAWALAQREPTLRRVLRRMDERWCAVLREVVDDGVARACSGAPTRRARWSGSRRCWTGCRSPPSSTARSRAPSCASGSRPRSPRSWAWRVVISHQPVRPVRRVGEAGAVHPERRHVGRRTSVDRQVGQQPAERGRELEAVRGSHPDHDGRVSRHR
jgi:AcrR family transcriptional regulator